MRDGPPEVVDPIEALFRREVQFAAALISRFWSRRSGPFNCEVMQSRAGFASFDCAYNVRMLDSGPELCLPKEPGTRRS